MYTIEYHLTLFIYNIIWDDIILLHCSIKKRTMFVGLELKLYHLYDIFFKKILFQKYFRF